jgi:signal peptidase I
VGSGGHLPLLKHEGRTMQWRVWTRKVFKMLAIVTGLFVLCAVTAIASALNEGYRAMIMRTESMSPVVQRGDVVFVRPISPERIEAGDIIAFTAPTGSNRLVTHRVVEVDPSPDGPAFITRGDANPSADPWQIRYLEYGWLCAFTVPYAGYPVLLAQGPHGNLFGLAIVFTLSTVILWPAIGTRFLDVRDPVMPREL